MPTVNVLRALMVFRIISQIDGGFVVHRQRRGNNLRESQLIEERASELAHEGDPTREHHSRWSITRPEGGSRGTP
eukprot:2008700-Pleurochrysis_carterae.AAC.1